MLNSDIDAGSRAGWPARPNVKAGGAFCHGAICGTDACDRPQGARHDRQSAPDQGAGRGDAQKQAAEIRAADEKRLAAGKAQVDAALAAEKQAQAKALDEEFLRAKHALDGRFDANRSAWLDGLCKDLFEA